MNQSSSSYSKCLQLQIQIVKHVTANRTTHMVPSLTHTHTNPKERACNSFQRTQDAAYRNTKNYLDSNTKIELTSIVSN